MQRYLVCVLLTLSVVACDDSDNNNEAGYPPIPDGPTSSAESMLNDLLRQQFPDGEPMGDGDVDDSIRLESASGSNAGTPTGQRAETRDGDNIALGVSYRTQGDTTVDAICVGFGSPNNGWCIPSTSSSVRSSGDGQVGALALDMQFPPELCSMLSQICHDIRCYESARTSAGTFSRANINMLAYACGNCTEPSCQELLDSCEPIDGADFDACQVFADSLRMSYPGSEQCAVDYYECNIDLCLTNGIESVAGDNLCFNDLMTCLRSQ